MKLNSCIVLGQRSTHTQYIENYVLSTFTYRPIVCVCVHERPPIQNVSLDFPFSVDFRLIFQYDRIYIKMLYIYQYIVYTVHRPDIYLHSKNLWCNYSAAVSNQSNQINTWWSLNIIIDLFKQIHHMHACSVDFMHFSI